MQNTSKNRAPAPKYVSTKQLSLTEFESPFERNLNPSNRWVILSKLGAAGKPKNIEFIVVKEFFEIAGARKF